MSAKTMRRTAVALLAAAVLVSRACPDAGETSAPEPAADDVVEARVAEVYDGDTIEIEWNGMEERVRYIGIDAAEMSDPRPRMREMARAATEANRERVGGRRVTLRFDVERRDRYGRLLAYVFVGDTLVNEWLVRRGYARAGRYPPNLRHDERLQAAEDAARAEDLRIWDGRLDGRPFRPDGGRRR